MLESQFSTGGGEFNLTGYNVLEVEDESRFSFSDSHRILIGKSLSRYLPSNIIREGMGGRGVLVWEAMVVVQTFTSSAGSVNGHLSFFFHICKNGSILGNAGSSFTTSNDSGASIGAANEWAAMPHKLIDTPHSAF
ncbi:hypothetical protein TNCV_534381 [Trichonephila clavipes]|nr:hypothetical protein TNCV_534381 [Trichonephila clavipes]